MTSSPDCSSRAPHPALSTPRSLGYRMPAEWAPHEATWLSWPRKEGRSFEGRFETILPLWIAMCRILSRNEKVHINAFDEAHEEEIRKQLVREKIAVGQRVFLHRFPAYEPWCRDHGPIFVTQDANRDLPGLAVVDWIFNTWGMKYPPYDRDDAIPRHVAHCLDVPLFEPGIVMEGGSLDVNGQGTLLTTEACLLNRNRNPRLTRSQIEERLRDYLGVTRILWLGQGLKGDDTDGHVDDLSRFVDPQTVVTVVEEDPKDVNHAPLQENLRRLREMKDQDGRPLRIVPLPTPGVVACDGNRLPASYANFYIANGTVLLPVYNHPNDIVAQRILQELLPDREVIPLDCRKMIWGRGAIHCVTQQQPRPGAGFAPANQVK